jgi:hypothetical protein
VSGLFGLLVLALSCLFGLVGIALLVMWIWMLIDCATNEPPESNEKLLWLLIIIFTGGIGGIIYYFVRRPERKRLYQR